MKRSILSATAVGVGAFTLTGPAFGFFPPVVSGTGTVSTIKPPPIIPPPPYVIPPVTPPCTPPVSPPPCTCTPGTSVTPQDIPEPATLVSAGMGLAALAASRRRKGSKS